MSYQVLARKWRPRIFAELVGQEHVVRALTHALDSNRVHHAFLFTGTRGVGKTTIARILAKSLNCERGVSSTPCGECRSCREVDEGRFVDLLEVDAASRTKVDDTRELLDNVQYAPARGRYKVYLVDEVHMLSAHSFNALLKTLEEPPPHVKFLLATTDPQKLPVTVLSRCLQFNLKRLSAEKIGAQIEKILGAESVAFDAESVRLLAQVADGSMRDGLSLLDQAIAYGGGSLNEIAVREMIGTVDDVFVDRLLDALARQDAAAALDVVAAAHERSQDFDALLSALLTALHRLAVMQEAPDAAAALGVVTPERAALAGQFSGEDLQLYFQIGTLARRELPLAPDARMALEMTLLRMLAFRPASDARAAMPSAAAPRVPASPASTSRAKPASPPTTPSSASKLSMPSAGPSASSTGNDWATWITGMNLTGLPREFASNMTLQQATDDCVVLALDAACVHLRGAEREAALKAAIESYLGRTIRLRIEVADAAPDTPARVRARDEQARQQAAEAAIASDPNVQRFSEVFGAAVRPGSVRPRVQTETDPVN